MQSKNDKSSFEQFLNLAKQKGYITKAEFKTFEPDADEDAILLMSHLLPYLNIKLFEQSPTEDELILLQSEQEEEISEDILREAEFLCSVDHDNGRTTDPRFANTEHMDVLSTHMDHK